MTVWESFFKPPPITAHVRNGGYLGRYLKFM